MFLMVIPENQFTKVSRDLDLGNVGKLMRVSLGERSWPVGEH